MKKRNIFPTLAICFLFVPLLIGIVHAGPCELAPFNSANFNAPIDNPYLSRNNIGYTYTYEAETDEGLVRDFIYFTTDTKTILGVSTTVVYDVEWLWVEDIGQWRKLEETYDWHAWDNEGNFWYFGEDTIAYEYDENWNLIDQSTEGAWEAGVDGAMPGIILLSDPKPGDCVLQEYYKDEAEDRGRVLRLNANVSDYCDKDCLVTKEWTKLDPGNIEHKYYAPEIGLVFIEELKEKTVIYELVNYSFGPPPAIPADR